MKQFRNAIVVALAAALINAPEATAVELHDTQVPPPTQAQSAVHQRKYVTETQAADVEKALEPITFEECENSNPGNQEFTFKDKYNACFVWNRQMVHREINDRGLVVEVGTTTYRVTVVGLAQDRTNAIDFKARVTWVSSSGKVIPDDRLSLAFSCLNAEPGLRESTCDYPHEETDNTIAEWKLQSGTVLSWRATATTTKVPADDGKYANELRGYFAFDLREGISSSRIPLPPVYTFLPTEYFRCDSATYVYGSKCVYNRVVSTLVYDSEDESYKQSAQFFKDAQEDITRTKPGLIGKKVPGRFNEEPLTYLYSGYDTSKVKAGSRRKIRRECRREWGANYAKPVDAPTRHCDEYPFAGTYQNAALVDESSPYSFAVRVVNAAHNVKTGQIFSTWVGQDHILDGDPFYVVVR